MTIPVRFGSGFRLHDGNNMDNVAANPQWQQNPAVTAVAGALSSSTPVLLLGINVVTTTPSTGGVVLPSGILGGIVHVRNSGSNTLTVFAAGSDTIDTTAGSTGVTIAAGKSAIFFGYATTGKGVDSWTQFQSA